MSDERPGDRILTYLDTKVKIRQSLIILACIIIFVPPIMVWVAVSGFFANTRTNVVRIKEMNSNVVSGTPEFPFIKYEDYYSRDYRCYAKVSTIKEAEDLLLRRGYKCRYVWTRIYNDELNNTNDLGVTYGEYNDSRYKTFLTKGKPGSKYESVVMIDIDYGDHDNYLLQFRYQDKDNPINFSRFERIKLPKSPYLAETGMGCRCPFEFALYSTHYSGPGRLGSLLGEKWNTGVYNTTFYEEEVAEQNKEEKRELERLKRKGLIAP